MKNGGEEFSRGSDRDWGCDRDIEVRSDNNGGWLLFVCFRGLVREMVACEVRIR